MSPVLEERMLAAIGDAKTCPHGHPIVAGTRIEGVPLADVEPGATRPGAAPGERGRGPPALPQGPGARARHGGDLREDDGDEVVLDTGGTEVRVLRTVAETVSVVADPSPPPRVALPEQLVLARDRYGR